MMTTVPARLGRADYFLALAALVATRATCRRRRVGCVLVDAHRHVLATGYNGNAAGLVHCLDAPCAGATAPSGTALDACEAIHAEQNALLQVRDAMTIEVAYVTTLPCVTCLKLLLNTSCRRIVYADEYPRAVAPAVYAAWATVDRQLVRRPIPTLTFGT